MKALLKSVKLGIIPALFLTATTAVAGTTAAPAAPSAPVPAPQGLAIKDGSNVMMQDGPTRANAEALKQKQGGNQATTTTSPGPLQGPNSALNP